MNKEFAYKLEKIKINGHDCDIRCPYYNKDWKDHCELFNEDLKGYLKRFHIMGCPGISSSCEECEYK